MYVGDQQRNTADESMLWWWWYLVYSLWLLRGNKKSPDAMMCFASTEKKRTA